MNSGHLYHILTTVDGRILFSTYHVLKAYTFFLTDILCVSTLLYLY